MFKSLMAALVMFFASVVAMAAVDVNKASQAELESVKGIGPAISAKILDERKKGTFKDWTDFIDRVKGVGEGNAAKFSAEGLTVGGATFKGVAAKPAETKPAAKAEPAKAAAPAAAAATTAAAAKPAVKEEPAMAKSEKNAKGDKADAKSDKKAKKDDKDSKDEKASAKK